MGRGGGDGRWEMRRQEGDFQGVRGADTFDSCSPPPFPVVESHLFEVECAIFVQNFMRNISFAQKWHIRPQRDGIKQLRREGETRVKCTESRTSAPCLYLSPPPPLPCCNSFFGVSLVVGEDKGLNFTLPICFTLGPIS